MTKLLIHPPEGTTSFTHNLGCGQAHEYDGEHGIDCPMCVDYVATISPDERTAMHLRGAPPVQGGTPEEIAAYAKAYRDLRERYSWRLIPQGKAAPEPLAVENEALKNRVAELEAAGQTVPGSNNASLESENEALRARVAELEAAAEKPAKKSAKA